MKISLHQQIDEVERELKMREEVYPRQVSSGKLRQSIADYQIDRLKAVKVTLEWLRDNETDVRGFVVAKIEARKKAEAEADAGDVCPDCKGKKSFTALVDGTNYRGPVSVPCKRCSGTGYVKKGEAA